MGSYLTAELAAIREDLDELRDVTDAHKRRTDGLGIAAIAALTFHEATDDEDPDARDELQRIVEDATLMAFAAHAAPADDGALRALATRTCRPYTEIYETRPAFGRAPAGLVEQAATLALPLAAALSGAPVAASPDGERASERAQHLLRSLAIVAGAPHMAHLGPPDVVCAGPPSDILPGPTLPDGLHGAQVRLGWLMLTRVGELAHDLVEELASAEQDANGPRFWIRHALERHAAVMGSFAEDGLGPTVALPPALRPELAVRVLEMLMTSALIADAEGPQARGVIGAEARTKLLGEPGITRWERRTITTARSPDELAQPLWAADDHPPSSTERDDVARRARTVIDGLPVVYEGLYRTRERGALTNVQTERLFAEATDIARLLRAADGPDGRQSFDESLDAQLAVLRSAMYSLLGLTGTTFAASDGVMSPKELARRLRRVRLNRESAQTSARLEAGQPIGARAEQLAGGGLGAGAGLAILFLSLLGAVTGVLVWALITPPPRWLGLVLFVAELVASAITTNGVARLIAGGYSDEDVAYLRQTAASPGQGGFAALTPGGALAGLTTWMLGVLLARLLTAHLPTALAEGIVLGALAWIVQHAITTVWFGRPARKAAVARLQGLERSSAGVEE